MTKCLFGLGVSVTCLLTFAACSQRQTEGEAIAWKELVGNFQTTPACANKGNGKVYAVEGYAHWNSGWLCRNSDCGLELYKNNNADGTPDTGEEPIRFSVKKKNFLGMGDVAAPQMSNQASKTDAMGNSTTTGTVDTDSLALEISDDSVVNNRVRLRVFLEVVDTNGVCTIAYRGAVRAPEAADAEG